MYLGGIVGRIPCTVEMVLLISVLVPWAPDSSNHDWSTTFNIVCLEDSGPFNNIWEVVGIRNHIRQEA
jgi:hypothetical protein